MTGDDERPIPSRPHREDPRSTTRDFRASVPPGTATFDLLLGDMRVRIVDLPTAWDPFVSEQYAPFAEAPGQPTPDVVIRCREGEGLIVPLPPPGQATDILLHRQGGRRIGIRSHWQDGFIDLDRGEGELVLTERAWDRFAMSVENYLRVAMQLASIERGAFLFHAAAILDGGRCHLFFGHSGAGKSTATSFSMPRQALSDDMVLIETGDGAPVARAVPFHMVYPPELRVKGRWPIAGAFRLRQSPEDRLQRLSPARAVATVSTSVPFVHELGLPHQGLTDLVTGLCARVPVYDLYFTKSARFWDLIQEIDGRGGDDGPQKAPHSPPGDARSPPR